MLRERRPARRFLLGWICGAVYWCGICYWVEIVLAVHGDMGKPIAWTMFVLFFLAKAMHWGCSRCWREPDARGWAVPAVAAWWVAVEASHGSLGFAWLALGNAGVDMSWPMRLAPYTGVYGFPSSS